MSRIRKDTLRLVAVKSAVALAGRILSIPSGMIVAYYLGPFHLGVLAILQLIQQYAGYTHLGILDALFRNVPIAYGRGDADEAVRIARAAYTGWLISLVTSIAGLWIAYGFGVTFGGALDFPRMVLVSVILVLNGGLTFLRDYAKAEGRLMVIAKSDVVQALAAPLITIPAVIWLGVTGALMSIVATNAATLVRLFNLLDRPVLRLSRDWQRMRELVRTGVLVLVNRASDQVFWSVDLMILAVMRTPAEVGVFTIALAALQATNTFVGGINQMAYRKMMTDTGTYGIDTREHYRTYVGPLLVTYLLVNTVTVGLATLGVMFLVRVALSDYAASVDILIVLTLGYTIYSSMVFMRYYMDATGQLPRRLTFIFGALAVNALLDYAVLAAGLDLRAVAWAGTFSFFLSGAVILTVCFRQILGRVGPAVDLILRLLCVAALCTGFLALSHGWMVVAYGSHPSTVMNWLLGLLDSAIKAALYVGLCVGAYLAAFRRYRPEKELLPVLRYVWGWTRRPEAQRGGGS